MTLIETMAIVYAISIPTSFFICKSLIKNHGEEIQKHTNFELRYIPNILSLVPVINTVICVYAIFDFLKYYLYYKWVKDKDDENNDEGTTVDDLRP